MDNTARNIQASALSAPEFLQGLVECRSVSGDERQAAEFAVAQMQALGYREAYVDSVNNAIGIWGSSDPAAKTIMLLGHIDTVRGEIPVRVEETTRDEHCYNKGKQEVLHGRGSVDAKGPFATFIQAVAQMDADSTVQFIVVGAVEEEAATSKGARQILKDFPEPACVIIGEPSHTNGITLGYKGRCLFEFRAKRAMTHTAHEHISGAELAFAYHERVRAHVAKLNEDKKGIFRRLDYNIPSLVTESDGLHETVEMKLRFRLGPDFDPEVLVTELEELFTSCQEEHREDFEMELKSYGVEYPAQYDKKNFLAQAFRVSMRKLGHEPRMLLKTGTSDMNTLCVDWKCPIVAYGPGDAALDHTPEEHLSLRDYEAAIEVLSATLAKLSSQ